MNREKISEFKSINDGRKIKEIHPNQNCKLEITFRLFFQVNRSDFNNMFVYSKFPSGQSYESNSLLNELQL